MKKKFKTFRYLFEYLGVRLLITLLSRVPFKVAMRIALYLISPLTTLFPIRKKVVMENLRRAFPAASDARLKRILKESYVNLFLNVVEFIHLPKLTPNSLSERITEIEGEEYFDEVGGGKRAFLILTAHIGNWELMGAYFCGRGVPLCVLAKPLHNPYVNRFVNKVRATKGFEVISTREASATKRVLRTLRTGRGVAFLADQDARKAGIFINFFGKPASTFTGPALFSIRTGLPLLPVFGIRTGLTTHKLIFLPPIYPPEKEDRDAAIHEVTERHIRLLEDLLQRYPGQYFWFHRRWKSHPKRNRNV